MKRIVLLLSLLALAAVRLAPGAEIDPWAFRDSPHAESAESESHAESAETAEP